MHTHMQTLLYLKHKQELRKPGKLKGNYNNILKHSEDD